MRPDDAALTTLPCLVDANPYLVFAKVAAALHPMRVPAPAVHPSATVAPTARVAASAAIGAGAALGDGVTIGERVSVGALCAIGAGTSLADDVILHANVTLYPRTAIGPRTIVHSGAVIGADGFGMAEEGGRWIKIPQIGRVVIGDDVEIGANTTIDRGAIDDTVVEDGVKLDNQIQIGHNCVIGANTAIAGCVGIAGIDPRRPQLQDRRRGDDRGPPRHPGRDHRIGLDGADGFPARGGCVHQRLPGASASSLAQGDGAVPAAARSSPTASRSSNGSPTQRRTDARTSATRGKRMQFDIAGILRQLPHRYPFLLVDRVLECTPGKSIRALKNVTINEPFFQGHFPDYPLMPGVLVIEALAQVSGLLAYVSGDAKSGGAALIYFAGIDNARFKRQVVPGDQLVLEAEVVRVIRGIGKFRTRATVDGELACEAELIAAIRDRPRA